MTDNRRDTTMNPHKAILRQWPDAIGIRREAEKCPNCKRKGMFYSYVLPEYSRTYVSKLDSAHMEGCGFWCALCGWGNAGSRPIASDEVSK